MRVMMDTNVYDAMFADAALLELVGLAVRSGRMTAIITHVQPDELDMIKWPGKREALLALPIEYVKLSTAGMIWDVSRWDEADWSDETDRIDRMMVGNPKHAEDALIAATADAKADVFVSNETHMPSKVRRAGFTVAVWNSDQLLEWLSTPA